MAQRSGSTKRVNRWSLMCPCARVDFCGPAYGELSALLDLIPGIKRKDVGWLIPASALNVAAACADELGMTVAQAVWISCPLPGAAWPDVEKQLLASPEVRQRVAMRGEELPLVEFLRDYQKDAITFGRNRLALHLWLATGAGKTCIAILTAIATPGPIVVITRAAARLQLAREIRRLTSLEPFVIRPTSDMRSVVTVDGLDWRGYIQQEMPRLHAVKAVAAAWRVA